MVTKVTLYMMPYDSVSCKTEFSVFLGCRYDQLRLTCSTNDSVLTWTVFPPGVDDSGFDVIVLGSGSVSPSEMVLNDNTFHSSITSLSPLKSLMLVDNVSANVNGTRVGCQSPSNGQSITNINIIEDGNIIIAFAFFYDQ